MHRHLLFSGSDGGTGSRNSDFEQPPQSFPRSNVFVNPSAFPFQQIPNFVPQLSHFSPNLPQVLPQFQHPFPNGGPPIQIIYENREFQPLFPDGNRGGNFPPRYGNAQNEMVEKIDKAARKAWADLLSSNKNVSAWKVSQTALLMVNVDSWESLGFQMQQVPSLNHLFAAEWKINAFIHCFVAVRRITSLYDLELAICESEGVKQFEELKLGPLLQHPLAIHYFSLTSNLTEVYKIRTEEIISCLCDFIETNKKKEHEVSTFLDFLSKKKSVLSREELCIRIHGFRFYVNHIKRMIQSEECLLEGASQKKRSKYIRRENSSLFSDSKRGFDSHFNEISQRVKSFSASAQFGGKHTRFASSSSEDDSENEEQPNVVNSVNNSCVSLLNVGSDRVSSCPYPSATEEMVRLGMASADSKSALQVGLTRRVAGKEHPQRKRGSTSNISPFKHAKRQKFKRYSTINNNVLSSSFSNEPLRIFISTWKEVCRENTADKVLEMMLQFYNTSKKSKMKKLFAHDPFSGLLSAAVTLIKSEMLDNVQNYSEVPSQPDVEKVPLESSDSYMDGGELDTNAAFISKAEYPRHKLDVVKAEDILMKISDFWGAEVNSYEGPSVGCKFHLLRKLWKCENWLVKVFAVDKFEALGHGDYFIFLEKYMHLLPLAVKKFMIGDASEGVCLEAHMLPGQLDLILSQALCGFSDTESISLQSISNLLARQFPLAGFKLVKGDAIENLQQKLRERECTFASSCICFSIPLLGDCFKSNSSALVEESPNGNVGHSCNAKTAEGVPVTTDDAIRAVLKAPMLTDLCMWLHWDIVFAPSLGSFIHWLLKDVKTPEFLCLVTKDSKVFRINHLASVDTFMKAFIQGSPFETALDLLSIHALHGGQHSVPVALLKSHAQKAFGVLISNYLDKEPNVSMNPFQWEKPSDNHDTLLNCNSGNSIRKPLDVGALNTVSPIMSRFILDCLSYLPLEFCSFATDILISGLHFFVMNASKAILTECKEMHQRLILHEVGISLGITEWVHDYHMFSSSAEAGVFPGSCSIIDLRSKINEKSKNVEDKPRQPSPSGNLMFPLVDGLNVSSKGPSPAADSKELEREYHLSDDPAGVIESIRKQEFGLDPCLSASENKMLEKQHSRLGRALRCISQELYSQDSHFLLELVQNADDNIYPHNVAPMLVLILQERSIVVLNNENGFSASDIRALCDVGNSTKKNHKSERIGKKGIGFKSVFRVTDAPEVHSNGFHIKFDITEGQIGFILPTIVPPHDIDPYTRLDSSDADSATQGWNTCIVLPLKSDLSEISARNNIFSMFSDLHPSLLLFLRRLQCIKFRNTLDGTCALMRKEVKGNGIVQVSVNGNEMPWFVKSHDLNPDVICSDWHASTISVAFPLKEIDQAEYAAILDQQPVFAFLPLRTYGLKFILQGDFALPSSREEIDGSSPWNQWLLSEVPDLFFRAGRAFCDLPCYKNNPGKAVSLFMRFVPMVVEVQGFFSSLPRMIISKLRTSNCLLLEDDKREWVPPFKVLRNWNDQARSLLPDGLLQKHLGLGFLDKDIVLSDSLARALGVEDYGPTVLLRVLSSLCPVDNGLASLGLHWLSSCLSAVYMMLSQFSPRNESDFILDLKKIPFIPLADGKYCSLSEGVIWLHYDVVGKSSKDDCLPKEFSNLFTRLRLVSPKLLDAASSIVNSCPDTTILDNVARMLLKIGIQRVSAHDILKMHVLPAVCDYKNAVGQESLIVEYVAFAMFHLLSNCTTCSIEREGIFVELRTKALILTNFGFKRVNEVPIHFSLEYGNPVDIDRLINGFDIKWHEIDSAYLEHPITKSTSDRILKWRKFFLELGVTDFVQVVQVEQEISDISSVNLLGNKDLKFTKTVIKDWKSDELFTFVSALSSTSDDVQRSKYLLEILDNLWDEYFGDKVTGCYIDSTGESKPFKSSFICVLQNFHWMCSTMGKQLNRPKDLYQECLAVNSILGVSAPYAAPKVKSEKLIADLGLKTEITLDDALSVLRLWRSETPLKASVAQMNNFYAFIWKGMGITKKKVIEELCLGPFIFIPNASSYSLADVVPGTLYSTPEVYWNDVTVSNKQVMLLHSNAVPSTNCDTKGKTLFGLYPNLHEFFVDECGVAEHPTLSSYFLFLQQLSNVALPHEAAKRVFEVFLIWGDALKSGALSLQDIEYLKENLLKKECTILPTRQDKWVSLHSSYGLNCRCDDDNLGSEFRNIEGVDFLYFGDSVNEVKQMLLDDAYAVMQRLGIPSISEVVTREAIYYGATNISFFHSLVNWALPYAQRYIYFAHAEKYAELKTSDFINIRHLQIIAVEKLFYRNVINSCGISSTKRTEIDCLHQGPILYCTPKADPHLIFMELSCLLYSSSPDLLFANFLHMIKTMAESGATEGQIESFIVNSQKVPKLPDEESSWSVKFVSSLMENENKLVDDFISVKFNEQKSCMPRRISINSNWPPVDWKTAPGFSSGVSFASTKPECSSLPVVKRNVAEDRDRADITPNINCSDFEADPTQEVVSLDNEISDSRMISIRNSNPSDVNVVLDSVDLVSPDSKIPASICSVKDQMLSQQALLTGRYGEIVAYKYLVEKEGEEASVRWVNETNETGLPYDIVVGEENEEEYIEVKATNVSSKLWFFISMREWEFAIEKGESFSIAHVALANNNMARITIYKNPARLWRLGSLKLAAVPKQ